MRLILSCLVMISLGGCMQSTSEKTSAPLSRTATPVTPIAFHAGEKVTLEVPTMHCPVMCYPKVKETLEGMEGVAAVALVPQKEDGVIDDHRVSVEFKGDMTSTDAIAALTQAGFPDAKFE